MASTVLPATKILPDERQQRAIGHVHGPMLVIAGAGTGKTTVLTQRVANLIEGLETPYSLELLTTVLWVLRENPGLVGDAASVVAKVHAWNARKRKLFPPERIKLVWQRLHDQGWLSEARSLNPVT